MSQKKTTTSNQFSVRQLVSAYNAYYKFGNPKGKTRFTFREYKKEKSADTKKDINREKRKFVIKLPDFEAVGDFKKAYESGKQNKMDFDPETSQQLSESVYLKMLVENHVYDIHLRSCLSIAAAGFKLHPKPSKNDEEGSVETPNGFYDLLVPQLGFTSRKEIEAKDYIESTRAYFESDALRIKGFNKVFPHSIRNEEREKKGINYYFLQRLVPRYDEILKDVVVEKKNDLDILMKRQQDIAKKAKSKKQLADMNICTNVMNPPEDKKWISKLLDITDKKKEKSVISKEVQVEVQKMVHELLAVKSFLSVVRRSIEAAEDEDAVEKAYKSFTEMCEELDRFNARHKTIENTFEAFAKYIVDATFILKDTFGIQAPLKLITSSIKNKVEFKFTRKLKEYFDELINAYTAMEKSSEKTKVDEKEHIEELTKKIAEFCQSNANAISIVKGYNFLDKSLEIYSNVGRYVNVALPKNYRIAIGIAMIKWINEKIELIAAENKKRESLIIDFKE